MCGICGWLSLDGSPVERGIVRKMTAMIAHRGPDGDGHHFEERIGFGHRRLAIIDPAQGQQPLANDDETIWITYNGEIYNFPSLMAQLIARGHRFRTRCDTEVVVRAYEEWGLDCLSRLNGMFAFALWDRRAERLLLARDPFGIKPLYVSWDRRHLLFSSEMKTFLLDPTFRREVDPVALDEYLTYQFVPAPRTIFRGVQKLRSGHYLLAENGRVREHAFARMTAPARAVVTEAAGVADVQQQLAAAVERQMISDVPIGALLSGGVDSATVCALMRQATDGPVKTFTVGFEGNYAKNELTQAKRTAEILGTDHYDVVISAQDCLNSFDEIIWHLDEPLACWSVFPMYWVSRLAAQHVKVVLTGQGADEPWAGYRRHRGERLGELYRRAPSVVRDRLLGPAVRRLPRAEGLKRGVFALGTEDFVQRLTQAYTSFTPEMKRKLYRDNSTQQPSDALRYWAASVADLGTMARHMFVDTRFCLPDYLLTYGDKMSMAWSLEGRQPMLDLELMELVEGLPTNLRFRGWSGQKYLYRKAIARWLPAEILQRPKIGFVTPFDEWFQRELTGQIREELTAPSSACAHYFDRSYIGHLIDQHAARREDYTRMLLNLLVFERWHAMFVRAPSEGNLPTSLVEARARSRGAQVMTSAV
jgi:asparagine synthase (glutamine-hydrolysing)